MNVNEYADAALRSSAASVANAPVGQRNHALLLAACGIGRLVHAGALAEDGAIEALSSAAEAAGLADREIAAAIQSGFEWGNR